MKFGKTDLIRRISDVVRNGWSNVHVRDLVESLWRDPFSMRTSGFVNEGGTDATMDAMVGMVLIDEVPYYSIAFTIAPAGRKFHFYQFREVLSYHKKYIAETITFDATEGLHAIYYDFDDQTFEQVLKHIENPTHDDLTELFQWVVPITFIYFNADSHEIIYFGDNRHGSWWNPWIHFSWHQTFNSMRESGLEFTNIVADGDGSLDAHAQFGISGGTCFHEDIYTSSPGADAPAGLPVFYFIQGNLPRIYEGSTNSLVVNGLVCYNKGGAVLSATERYFVMVHVFYTNCLNNPLIAVMGQEQYEKVSTASYMLANEVTTVKKLLPHQNLLHVGTLILETSVDFTNRYHARIVTYATGVETEMSVTGDGSKVKKIKLVNDELNPGAGKYYGTDEEGKKGYHPVIDNYADSISFDNVSRELTIGRTGELQDLKTIIPSGQPDVQVTVQEGHGFTLGTAIRNNGTIYVKAKADNSTHAQVCGIVSEIIDEDHFKYVTDGFIPGVPGVKEWTLGAEYFLSPATDGEIIVLSDPEIWMIGQVRISLGWGTTKGLKVEIDVGDEIGNYAGSEPFSFDKDFEFCINEGVSEIFKLDISAAYSYTISRIKAESDGTLNNVAVKINDVAVTGLDNFTISTIGAVTATGNNVVEENDLVTIHTTESYSGTPTVLRLKLIYTIK